MAVGARRRMYSRPCVAIMAYKIELMPRAERDLRLIFLDCNAVDSARARDWFYGLEARILSLSQQPGRGTITDKKRSVLCLIYHSKSYSYRILYRINAKQKIVHVLHIRHASRKPL
jgi:toxin ParE1/3/4